MRAAFVMGRAYMCAGRLSVSRRSPDSFRPTLSDDGAWLWGRLITDAEPAKPHMDTAAASPPVNIFRTMPDSLRV